jgi:hypothetical protein
MTRSKAKVIGVFVGVFLLGGVAGAALDRVVSVRRDVDLFEGARRGSRHGVFLWSLDRKLELRADQRQKIQEILASYDRDVAEIPSDPRVAALRTRMRAELRATLDPEQQRQFDELMASWDAVRARPVASAQ